MRIGIVTTWFERGAAYVSRQYMRVLQPEHEVLIYARGFKDKPENSDWDGEHVHWAKPTVLPVAMAIDKVDFLSWLKRCRIDIVFFNEQQWWPPVLWAKEAGVKTGAYVDYYTEETIPLFAAYDFLICNTRRHHEAFAWHPQCYFIRWGTEVDVYAPKTVRPVSNETVFFQSCGYSPLRKGTDFVVEAFSQLVATGASGRLVIHTQVDLQLAMPRIAKLLEELLCRKKLQVIHKTVPAPGLYHLGDVYVAPSRLEGIGLTAAEALASGLPFVTSDFPPMNEFVSEQSGRAARIDRLWARSDGYYWPQCRPSIESLSEILRWYVDQYSQLAKLKKDACQYAAKYLNWYDRKPQLLALFEKAKSLNLDATLGKEVALFEGKRSGLQQRLAMKYPWLYQLLRHRMIR